MINKATKKPVTIEYVEWTGDNAGEVEEFTGDSYMSWIPSTEQIELTTREGSHFASKGDLIIKGVAGEFYPCKPDIFAKTYDLGEPAAEPEFAWQLTKIKDDSAAKLEFGPVYDGSSDAVMTLVLHNLGKSLIQLGTQLMQSSLGDPEDEDYFDEDDDTDPED